VAADIGFASRLAPTGFGGALDIEYTMKQDFVFGRHEKGDPKVAFF
jgi:hypothetical protein